MGIILYELLMPFHTESERIHQLQNVRRKLFPNEFDKEYPEEVNLFLILFFVWLTSLSDFRVFIEKNYTKNDGRFTEKSSRINGSFNEWFIFTLNVNV